MIKLTQLIIDKIKVFYNVGSLIYTDLNFKVAIYH